MAAALWPPSRVLSYGVHPGRHGKQRAVLVARAVDSLSKDGEADAGGDTRDVMAAGTQLQDGDGGAYDVNELKDERLWSSVSATVDIVGASREDAWAIYSNLSNHPKWSLWLTHVEDFPQTQTSEWTIRALGITFSWMADTMCREEGHCIAWESTTGTKNKGVASFADLPGGSPGCRVSLQISMPLPRTLRKLLPVGQLTRALQGVLQRDLQRYRDVVMAAGKIALIGRASLNARTGSATLALWDNGRLDVELSGWGSAGLVEDLCDNASSIIGKLDKDVPIRALLDMRRGVGSPPLAVQRPIRFLKEDGYRIVRGAIIASWPIAQFARFAVSVAGQTGVAFFSDVESAEVWLRRSEAPECVSDPGSETCRA